MALIERCRFIVGMREARSTLPQIIAALDEHPARVFEVMRNRERAAIILSPVAFEQLVDVAEDALDVCDAENDLTSESLGRFGEYHARRMASSCH